LGPASATFEPFASSHIAPNTTFAWSSAPDGPCSTLSRPDRAVRRSSSRNFVELPDLAVLVRENGICIMCLASDYRDVVRGQIYRWRRDLRSDATGFAEVVVAPDRSERSGTDVPALTIELGRDIRVRIAATAPAALVTAVIKALAPR
jgi:transposase